ncbi:MAG: DUF4339 domain-containing protein, partial [Deltaproteobacteria bacterium]|nr:DUF4339 domain-containing protein [Deltaproteobacteria bacterium]
SSRVRAGDFHPRTYVWRDGMAEWVRAADVPELARLLPGAAPASPPPPPPAAVAQSSPARSVSSPGVAKSNSPGVASSSGPDVDPFAAFGSADPKDLPPPGEATMVAIAQAGVNKRNPPWKFALFALAIIGGPAALFFGLANVEVRQIQVDASGNEVAVDVSLGEVVAGDGLSGLGNLLMGKKKKAVDAPARVDKPAEPDTGPRKVAEVNRKEPGKKPTGPTADPNDPYDDSAIGGKGPIAAKEEKVVVASSTFNSEGALKVFKQNASAFQGCVDMELKKNPNAKLGKLILTATVAPSGTVTGASIDKKDVDRSSLGECLRMRAKRMVFPPFDGEPTDVELPIVAGAGF